MGRPHSASTYPPSLFRVIKVPVARHRQETSIKPNPTIAKRLGGYHRRISNQDQTKKRSFINFVKNAFRKVKDVFRLPSSPYMRRIQELEDDIQLLRHKNEILEKGYTFVGSPDRHIGDRADAPPSSTTAKFVADATWPKEGGEPDKAADYRASDMDTDEGRQPIDRPDAVPLPPPPPAAPAPPLRTEHQSDPAATVGGIPVPPPAPPVGSLPGTQRARPLPNSEPGSVSHPVSAPAPITESSAGICINDILSVKLKPVQQNRHPPDRNNGGTFRVSTEQLFSVPLKPVSRRGRRPARKDSGSDNEDFKILRAAMRSRIESLYSPSISTAGSDADWSVSPNLRSRRRNVRNGAVRS